MASSTGRTAASPVAAGRQLWAVNDKGRRRDFADAAPHLMSAVSPNPPMLRNYLRAA
ncbi:MAG: hypothetical protein ABJH85_21585 [Paracoccaceae bacterium]|uniref:hypothetical protein n=1 Tax=Parasphingorhabdus sp. TaxID=2709688 RepID=UPI00329A45A6